MLRRRKMRCPKAHRAGLGKTMLRYVFFQAEDGIRYCSVTGVQTCALPIFTAHYRVSEHSARIRFFTDSALNLLILVAILVQAYIYVRQWAVMEKHGRMMEGQLDVMRKSLLDRKSVV